MHDTYVELANVKSSFVCSADVWSPITENCPRDWTSSTLCVCSTKVLGRVRNYYTNCLQLIGVDAAAMKLVRLHRILWNHSTTTKRLCLCNLQPTTELTSDDSLLSNKKMQQISFLNRARATTAVLSKGVFYCVSDSKFVSSHVNM